MPLHFARARAPPTRAAHTHGQHSFIIGVQAAPGGPERPVWRLPSPSSTGAGDPNQSADQNRRAEPRAGKFAPHVAICPPPPAITRLAAAHSLPATRPQAMHSALDSLLAELNTFEERFKARRPPSRAYPLPPPPPPPPTPHSPSHAYPTLPVPLPLRSPSLCAPRPPRPPRLAPSPPPATSRLPPSHASWSSRTQVAVETQQSQTAHGGTLMDET